MANQALEPDDFTHRHHDADRLMADMERGDLEEALRLRGPLRRGPAGGGAGGADQDRGRGPGR